MDRQEAIREIDKVLGQEEVGLLEEIRDGLAALDKKPLPVFDTVKVEKLLFASESNAKERNSEIKTVLQKIADRKEKEVKFSFPSEIRISNPEDLRPPVQVQQDSIPVEINVSSLGDNIIVYAIKDKKIVVLSYALITKDDVEVIWKSGDKRISGFLPLVSHSGLSADAEKGLMKTDRGESLVLYLSTSALVGGHLSYMVE